MHVSQALASPVTVLPFTSQPQTQLVGHLTTWDIITVSCCVIVDAFNTCSFLCLRPPCPHLPVCFLFQTQLMSPPLLTCFHSSFPNLYLFKLICYYIFMVQNPKHKRAIGRKISLPLPLSPSQLVPLFGGNQCFYIFQSWLRRT